MTSDVDILYQPQGTYRYARNINLVSQDGKNFVIKDALGNVKLTEVNKAYATVNPVGPVVTYQANPMIIAMISFPDKAIIFSTNAESVDGDGNPVGGYGEIGILKYENYGEGIQPISVSGNDNNGYVPLYHHSDLDFSKLKRIEGFAYQETDDIQRVYWTDNFNEPRVMNIGDPIFTTYIASGSIANGTEYMVVEGIITYNAVQYGPGLAAGNIFTGTATTTYTDVLSPNPTAKVVEYYPIQLLNFVPSRSMGNIYFKNYGAGSVYCGAKIYFYRLSVPSSGIFTSWSYGSSPVHVGTDNDITAVPANPFFDFTGGGTTNALLNSGHSVVITIDNIDQSFSNIEVAVAEYDQSLDVIRAINIIANETITATSMDITHTGSDNLGELTISDITLFPASILRCKTMTTNKNYILIANVQERPEFDDFSNVGVTFTQIQHKIRAHQGEYGAAGSAQVCENVMSYNIPTNSNINPSTSANPALVDGIQPYTEWIVLGGVAGVNFVTYNGVNYGAEPAGQFFRGVPGQYNYTITGVGVTVRPAVFKNKYTTTALVNKTTGIQFNSNDSYQWNYKNPAVASLKKGYWSNQTYRFGILFYDLKGNPFFVRWLDDFTFDDCISTPLTELVQVNSGGDDDWYLNQNGVSISGITIPPSVIDIISGFSIVRAERDATIMTQGILQQVMYNAPVNWNLPSPNMAADSLYTNNNGQLMTYVCPDNLVAYPVENYTTGSKLSLSHYVIPRTVFGSNMKASSDGGEAFETKYLEVAAAENPLTTDPDPNKPILAKQDVIELQSVTNFGSGNWDYFNSTGFSIIGAPVIDTACSAPVVLDATGGVGGPRTLFEIDDAFYGYNQYPTVNYGDITNASLNKIMANITVSKTNLYGGQSSSALSNTFYISTGHFQPITAQVKTDTLSGGNYVFNNVEVWGGDCFNCLVTYGNSLYAPAPGTIYTPPGMTGGHSWAIKFACQCNSNYDLRRGRLVEAVRMYPAAAGVNYSTPQLEGFSYNKGYSSQGLAFLYPALPVNFSNSGQFRFRIRYAGEKFPAEVIDSYRVFNSLDFKDTDGHGGEINNLKTKDGRTIVWQNKAVDTVPILERQVVSGQSGEATTIGTGGVVDRFDPITSYYGNQHQWSVTEAEYGYFWFDMRRKAFVALDFGGGIQEISLIEGLKGFFDEAFLEVLGFGAYTGEVVNSQTFDEASDRPLIGVGITGVYDPKFKMSYMTFKFYSRTPETGGTINELAKDFTIGYYHPSKMFTSFYDWTPAMAHNHNQWVFSWNNPKNKTKYYGASMDSTTFAIGDVVSYNNAEYICYADVTIASYPGTAPQIPDAAASAYWTRINQTHEIWVHNMPSILGRNPAPDYLYNSFFGQVVDNEVWPVINPKTQNPFNVLNIEQHGNRVNVTSLYTEADSQSASDTSISTTSRFYQVIYDAICSSLPLTSTNTRITARYLLTKFVKKNWTGSAPTVVSTSTRAWQYLTSFFQEKR